MESPQGTFSIVALDPESGDVGVAVQSRYFAVGAVVPWARAGVGAVATQAAGGDRRGQQSAALVVERPGGIPESREGIDRIVDLRVDDHEEPIRELRRLLGLHTRMALALETSALYERREWGAAIAATQASLERFPDDPLLLYNLACYESLDGRREAALAHLAQALAADPTMRESARADSDFAALAGEPQFRALVEA